MFTCRVISNHRIKDRKVMFGDQGIFIDRELFFQAGKFPAIPVMEDYQFSLTLKEMGVRLGLAKGGSIHRTAVLQKVRYLKSQN